MAKKKHHKTRNFVAKNTQHTSGAGVHKQKKNNHKKDRKQYKRDLKSTSSKEVDFCVYILMMIVFSCLKQPKVI